MTDLQLPILQNISHSPSTLHLHTMHHLESLRRQHHALLPPYLLQLPPARQLAAESSQHFLVHHVLQDEVIGPHTAERGYERTFWRKIVAELEKGVASIQADDLDRVSICIPYAQLLLRVRKQK